MALYATCGGAPALGYIDPQAFPFAPRKVDDRYQLFFKAARASIPPVDPTLARSAGGPPPHALYRRVVDPHRMSAATGADREFQPSRARWILRSFSAVIAVESGSDPAACFTAGSRLAEQVLPDTGARYGLATIASHVAQSCWIPRPCANRARYLHDLFEEC